MLLKNANRVFDIYHASEDGPIGTVVDIRLLKTLALKMNACRCIFAEHNHPSANLQTSNADIKMTEKLKNDAA